jgi:signal transduction histidine kinase
MQGKMNNKSYNKPTISKKFFKGVMLIIVVFIGLLGFLLIHSEYSRFRTESESIREKLLFSRKALIKNEADKAASYIEYKKARIEKRLKESIKNRVNEAYAIAWNIYEQYHGEKTPGEIQKIVKDALRPIRFNSDRGYYFAFNLKGIEELFADRPEMEGKDMLAVQGAKGEYVVRDMLNIIKKKWAGFLRVYLDKTE